MCECASSVAGGLISCQLTILHDTASPATQLSRDAAAAAAAGGGGGEREVGAGCYGRSSGGFAWGCQGGRGAAGSILLSRHMAGPARVVPVGGQGWGGGDWGVIGLWMC